MGTPAYTKASKGKGCYTSSWSLVNGDTGVAITEPYLADRSVEITGTPGAGFGLVIEGSNDGANYVTLTDTLGNALTFAALASAVLKQILQNCLSIRPRITGGDGSTLIVVTILSRGTL